MPYSQGSRLPAEKASKLGHLPVIKSEWVKALVSDFEQVKEREGDAGKTKWSIFDAAGVSPLPNVWAVDGSIAAVKTDTKPSKEVTFIKTALLTIDQAKLDAIDKDLPHPLMLQDALTGSAIFHATVLPLKNVRTSLGSNYDAVRNIIKDSICIDEDGAFHETLKWISYQKWDASKKNSSPSFECPHCAVKIEAGLPHDADSGSCPSCKGAVFLSDMLGFHLDMDEDCAPNAVALAYMLIMELLMLFTAIRLLWGHTDKNLISETLFIKDGPLNLRSQYSKIVPNLRNFFEHAKKIGRPIYVIGQEKTGAFVDHLSSIARFPPPHARGEAPSYSVLTHDYVRREVYRSPDLANPYGKRTNWGEKVYIKFDPGTFMVLTIPVGQYVDDGSFPKAANLIGLDRILATLPQLISHKHEGALFPIELANGIASLSSYPSAAILKKFVESQG